jgi:hypothetical protein
VQRIKVSVDSHRMETSRPGGAGFLKGPGGYVSALSTGSNASSESFGGALLYADIYLKTNLLLPI